MAKKTAVKMRLPRPQVGLSATLEKEVPSKEEVPPSSETISIGSGWPFRIASTCPYNVLRCLQKLTSAGIARLADLYHSFMLQCADTSLPPSLSALPQKYSIPARLWETAFQMYMDRLCSALPPSLLDPAGHGHAVYSHLDDLDTAVLSILDHMQEYAVYAYIYYATLLEDISLSPFRSSWLEQLGDVARYRMQVAEIWHRLVPPTPSGPLVLSSSTKSESVAALAAKTASSPRPSTRPTPSGVLHIGKKGKQRAGRVMRDDSEMEDADTPAGDSIGTAALDDWLLDEVETWRNVAREWYFRGLEEASGTGRLHERLAALHAEASTDLNDLKTLYHRCKG